MRLCLKSCWTTLTLLVWLLCCAAWMGCLVQWANAAEAVSLTSWRPAELTAPQPAMAQHSVSVASWRPAIQAAAFAPVSVASWRPASQSERTTAGRTAVWVYKPTDFSCGPCQQMEHDLKGGDRELDVFYSYGIPSGAAASFPVIMWRSDGQTHMRYGRMTLDQLKQEIEKTRSH